MEELEPALEGGSNANQSSQVVSMSIESRWVPGASLAVHRRVVGSQRSHYLGIGEKRWSGEKEKKREGEERGVEV